MLQIHGLYIYSCTGRWRPRRSIIFCSWGSEEYGLLGSTEWAEVFQFLYDSVFNAFGAHRLYYGLTLTCTRICDLYLKSRIVLVIQFFQRLRFEVVKVFINI